MSRDYRYKIEYKEDAPISVAGSDSRLKINHLKSVSIKNTKPANHGELVLSGKYFVFPDAENLYFHTLRDYIAQFEILKIDVPDLVPLILCSCNEKGEDVKPPSCLGFRPKYSPEKFIRELYKDSLVIEDLTKVDTLYLENLYFIYLTGPDSLTQLVDTYGYDDIILETGNSYLMENMFSTTLRDRFSSHIKKTDPNKKIYVSRLKESVATWKTSEAWDIYLETGKLPEDYKLSLEIRAIAKAAPEAVEELQMKKARAYSVEDEIKLEEYFKSLGYEILSPGDYSVEEQIEIFSSSGHVAGAGGSGMTNVLFCNPDTKIILIAAGNRFNFGGHSKLAQALGKKTYFFPEQVTVDHRVGDYVRFPAQQIIDDIESMKRHIWGS